MGSLCADMLEDSVLPSWILCGWARGGLKAPAVGPEPSLSREGTDEFLLKAEKPKLLGEAIVVVDMVLSRQLIAPEAVASTGLESARQRWP